jgi:hypothetical protein
MKVRDSKGNEVYVSVYGSSEDDIQIDEAYYVDDSLPFYVPEEEIDYIMQNYQDAMYEAWIDKQVSLSDYYY